MKSSLALCSFFLLFFASVQAESPLAAKIRSAKPGTVVQIPPGEHAVSIQLERRLIHYGFVPSMVFFQQSEEIEPDFVHRILSHKPNYIIWLRPSPADSTSLEMLGDAGVRLIVLSGQSRHNFRGLRYRLDRSQALAKAFALWQRQGICKVIIPTENGYSRSDSTCEPGSIARKAGLETEYARPGKRSLREHLAALARGTHTGIIFDEDLWHYSLCAQAPAEVGALVRRARTLVLHPLNLPPLHLREATLDAVGFDWQAMYSPRASRPRSKHDSRLASLPRNTAPTWIICRSGAMLARNQALC